MQFREKFLKKSPKRMPYSQLGLYPEYTQSLNQSSGDNIGYEAYMSAREKRSKSALD